MNATHLTGNLTADIEMAQVGEQVVARFTVAAHDRERTVFLPVEAWNMPHLPNHLRKGSKVLVSGALRQDTWEAKDGSKRSKIFLVAYQVEFLDPKPAEAGAAREAIAVPAADEAEPPAPLPNRPAFPRPDRSEPQPRRNSFARRQSPPLQPAR